MIRLFNVYYPVRTLILLVGEVLVVFTSFLLGTVLRYQKDSYLVLNYEGGYLKILIVTALVLVFSHLFDLYDPANCKEKGEQFFRLLFMLGIVAMDDLIPVLAEELSALRPSSRGRQRSFDQYQQGCSDCRYDELQLVTGGRDGC